MIYIDALSNYYSEIDLMMKSLPKKGCVTLEAFMACALRNSYWTKERALIVCEMIYIDALSNYYTYERSILRDEDYDSLKKYLDERGSTFPHMSMDEGRFVNAVYR